MTKPENTAPIEVEVASPELVENNDVIVERKEATAQLQVPSNPADQLIPDNKILDYYDEAINCIRQDRAEADQRYLQFAEMVLNEGDPSSASKEALVNLLKLKSDGVNQMIKVLDLWTRMKMKDSTTRAQVYAYQQNNKYEVGSSTKPSPHIKRLIDMAQQMEQVENSNE